MIERLKVRFAYQRGFQVVDGSHVLETFDSRDEAFKYVDARDARVWLQCGRTVISGQSMPCDFAASFADDRSVGRIRKNAHGPGAGTWFWSMFSHDRGRVGGGHATVAIKDEAVIGVERAYTRFIAAGTNA